MKLPIEQWIAERHYSENVTDLFRESVICYRNEAYRASLLLSYIGLLTIVKETMLQSQPPTGFADAEWKARLRQVNNHESWEEAVFDSLVQVKKPIFRLGDDICEQLRYWRRRRNDAAHNKDNEIGGHYTESLWSFIKSNVPKMAVDGGKEGLLNKFADHFDDTKTPPGSDFKPLVREIPTSVVPAELPDFFLELPTRIDGRLGWYMKSDTASVLNAIFNLPNEKVVVALTDYLKEKDRDLKFLSLYPNRLSLMRYSPADLRTLWKTRILSMDAGNPFPIYCELLRNHVIPADELEQAHQDLFNRFNQQNYHKLPETPTDIPILVNEGFYDVVYKDAIVSRGLKKFMWVNEKCDMIASMVEYAPLRKKTVSTICAMAESGNPSQWLVRELNALFERKPEIKTAFEKVVTDLGITMPSDFV